MEVLFSIACDNDTAVFIIDQTFGSQIDIPPQNVLKYATESYT